MSWQDITIKIKSVETEDHDELDYFLDRLKEMIELAMNVTADTTISTWETVEITRRRVKE